MSDTPAPEDVEAAAPVLAMLPFLSPAGLAELEHALTVALTPAPTAAERRVKELGYLASLLEEIRPLPNDVQTESGGDRGRRKAVALRVPRLERQIYETRQPREAPDAPSAKNLVIRYRSWVRACRAAYGLRPDGRYFGPSNPWAQPTSGRQGVPSYTLEDARAAIRRCARELGRPPSAGDYHRWARDAKRSARERGVESAQGRSGHPLIPGIAVIYRLYPRAGALANRWRAALADVGLTDLEIALSRATRLGLRTTPTPDAVDEERMQLPLSAAIIHAREQGVSLDYLAGRSLAPGSAPREGATFNSAALVAHRKEAGVQDERLRAALNLPLGPWRRFLRGHIEPTLGELVKLAGLTHTTVDRLMS